jgi:hypothetical protein
MPLQVAYPRQVEAEQTVLPDFGQNIINAFAKGAMINQKARDLKNDLAKIALLEREQQFKEQKWPQEFAQKEREIGVRNLMLEMNLDARTRGLDLREMDLRNKWGEKTDQFNEFTNFTHGLRDIDPNAPDAEARYWQLVDENAAGAYTPAGRATGNRWWQQFNTNARTKRTAFQADKKAWYNDTAKTMFDGYPGPWDHLMDRNQWEDQYGLDPDSDAGKAAKSAGAPVIDGHVRVGSTAYDPKSGKVVPTAQIEGAAPTGDVFIKTRDRATGAVTGYITKPGTLVEKKIREWHRLNDRELNLPQQRQVPGYNVYPQNLPTDSSLDDLARQALQDPNATEQHKAAARARLQQSGPQTDVSVGPAESNGGGGGNGGE